MGTKQPCTAIRNKLPHYYSNLPVDLFYTERTVLHILELSFAWNDCQKLLWLVGIGFFGNLSLSHANQDFR
jgi:hypothetical protein